MTHQLRKSIINLPDETIHAAVVLHSRELKQWTENMRLYEEEQLTPAPEEPQRVSFVEGPEGDEAYTEAYVVWGEAVSLRRQRYPGPSSHPEVERAVSSETLEPDYELVDDLLPRPSELELLKTRYLDEVSLAEHNAILALVPRGKVRVYQARYQSVLQGEQDRRIELSRQRSALEDSDPDAKKLDVLLSEPVDKDRSPDDKKFMEDFVSTHHQGTLIRNKAAEMMSDIEDLTEDNVHSWTLGPLE